MAMDREDFRDEIRENIKRDTNGVSNVRINRWIEWAQNYLADLHTYEEMRVKYTGATVDGQTSYGFPTRMKNIYSMTLQNGASSQKLTYVPARQFDEKVPYAVTIGEGQSSFYVDYGVNFELYKIPDAIYPLTLRASVYPIELATDASVSELLRKDALITAIATTFGFWNLREIEDASYWGGELVPILYEASLLSDHSAEDWVPVARGFGENKGVSLVGEWWTNPFIGRRV
jgi:hypothetical protein